MKSVYCHSNAYQMFAPVFSLTAVVHIPEGPHLRRQLSQLGSRLLLPLLHRLLLAVETHPSVLILHGVTLLLTLCGLASEKLRCTCSVQKWLSNKSITREVQMPAWSSHGPTSEESSCHLQCPALSPLRSQHRMCSSSLRF